MESPGLVFPSAPLDVMANGADNLLPLFDDELPKDFMDWCENETIEVEGKEVSADEYYRFVRVGEEMDDNEVQGWGFDIHIERNKTY